MNVETILLLATAALSAGVLVCVLLLRGDVGALRSRVDALAVREPEGEGTATPEGPSNPRLAAARKAAAARAASRPGRTTVKKV